MLLQRTCHLGARSPPSGAVARNVANAQKGAGLVLARRVPNPATVVHAHRARAKAGFASRSTSIGAAARPTNRPAPGRSSMDSTPRAERAAAGRDPRRVLYRLE